MKKTIALILFVLISTLSFSQNSGVIISIDNQAPVSLRRFNGLSTINVDTIYVKSAASIISFDLDGVLSTLTYTNPLWIGTTYSLNMTGSSGGLIHTDTIHTSGNTFTINAFSTNSDDIRLKMVGNNNVGPVHSNGVVVKFIIKHVNDPFNIIGVATNNQVNFNWTTLPGTANKTSYVYDSSPTAPLGTGTQTNVTNLNYSISATDTVGFKYLHLRTTDTSITAWYTYKMKLTYTAPTPTTTVGITENTNAVSGFKVYPNPAKDIITVQYATSNNVETVVLYNIAGQIMSTETVESMGDNKVTFNIESYPQGIYFARIGTATYKFIKQ